MYTNILIVDLTNRTFEKIPTIEYAKDYVGGFGIATKMIWDEVPPSASGTDPENLLTLNPGPLTGTLFGNKLNMGVKSPLYTNSYIATAGMGGQFPSELRYAGIDNLVFKGKSETPVYVHIDNDHVEIKDASHLWGLDTQDVQARIKEELKDPDVQIACIGPAGENQVAYSMVVHDIQNTASKGGHGAVMGSKNLKAIAVRGTKGVKIADPEMFKKLWIDYSEWYYNGRGRAMFKALAAEGQAYHGDKWYTEMDMMVYGYFDTFKIPKGFNEPSQGDWVTKYMRTNMGCALCPFQCAHNVEVPGLGACGLNCMNYTGFRQHTKTKELSTWYKATRLCQMYGVDNMTLAGLVSFLMKLYEQGVITAADTDGIPMEWGSEKAILAVIEKTVRQEGFGKILKDGIIPAANAIGRGAIDWAIQYRNMNPFPGTAALKASLGAWYVVPAAQELWMHPPSADKDGVWPMLMEYDGKTEEEAKALVDKWASENSERHTGDKDAWKEDNYEKNADYCLAMEESISICDMTGHCDYPSDRGTHCGFKWGKWEAADALTAVTGVEFTPELLVEAVQRRRSVELAYYHLCEQARGEEEVTSQRLFEVLINRDGHYAGQAPDLEKLPIVTDNYYKGRGCDPDTGIPTRKNLEKSGLVDIADRLEKEGFDITSEDELTEEVEEVSIPKTSAKNKKGKAKVKEAAV